MFYTSSGSISIYISPIDISSYQVGLNRRLYAPMRFQPAEKCTSTCLCLHGVRAACGYHPECWACGPSWLRAGPAATLDADGNRSGWAALVPNGCVGVEVDCGTAAKGGTTTLVPVVCNARVKGHPLWRERGGRLNWYGMRLCPVQQHPMVWY